MAHWRFLISGHARTKGSWTPVPTKKGIKFRPASKRAGKWFSYIKEEFERFWGDREPLEGPVKVKLLFLLPRPKTVVRTHPTGRFDGDGDKLERAIWDAMTGVVYVDDSQVVKWSGEKAYTKGEPGVQVTISTDL